MEKFIIGLLIVINIVAFLMYGIDKSKAKRGAWRIPEATLLGIAFFGGSVGAFLGMRVFRHKTKHARFVIGVPAMLIFHILIAALVVYFIFIR
ncbi:MAG: DUF1294 domain-containing protein [Oscillospiraceae bacterium]|nr:DUF1294 domain-containing protein [Oscillospiraceae bacterium]